MQRKESLAAFPLLASAAVDCTGPVMIFVVCPVCFQTDCTFYGGTETVTTVDLNLQSCESPHGILQALQEPSVFTPNT